MIKYFFILLTISLFSCKESNTRLEKYSNFPESKYKPFFSIDSLLPNNEYLTHKIYFSDKKPGAAKFLFYVRNNIFFAKTVQPESNEFILFDLNSKLNETKKIEFKNANLKRSFDCALEKKITTKGKLEVFVFRIKKFIQLPSFFGDEKLDVIVFTTLKHGVIGSYMTDIDHSGNTFMIAPRGNILKEDIDYSQINEAVLE